MTGSREGDGRSGSGWEAAVHLLCRFESGGRHLDDLLDSADPGGSRWLVMEVFRKWWILERILVPRLRHRPRPVARNLLRLAIAECLSREGEGAPVVHHAVEAGRSLGLSARECGFLNGVLRGVLRDPGWNRFPLEATHPDWLVARWRGAFGKAACNQLLEWNQSAPELYVHAKGPVPGALPTPWEGFQRVPHSCFPDVLPELQAGRAYMQDPFARIPVDCLAALPGETVLDCCAAPGGKTRLLGLRMQGKGRLVAFDRSGRRMERLRQNLERFGFSWVETVAGDLVSGATEKAVPFVEFGTADAVLLDVPCSNTGVIRRRPDVTVRLQPAQIALRATEQLQLLEAAAARVRPGGRLVYSTCSIETEENDGVVEAFLAAVPGWRLDSRILSLPWECGHDGGGAFLLTRRVSG